MKTISIPVNNRPDHLRRVLDSIHANAGWRDWRLVFSCEPARPDCLRVLRLAAANAYTSINDRKRGCWTNTFLAADLAMSLGSTLNLYLEDDYLLSPDALALVDQWVASGREGVLCLRRPHEAQDAAQPALVTPYQTGLFGCGFAWHGSSWPLVRRQWFALAPMWDIAMEQLPLPQWRPLVNRSHGIGVVGTHTHGSAADLNLFGPAYDGAPVTSFTFLA